MRIAVDAMGGDFAPAAVVEGALEAARSGSVEVTLVGRETAIRQIMGRLGVRGDAVLIVDAPDVIEMDEPPAQAVRRKKSASLVVCADLVRDGEADGMFSAGNTGAGMAVSLFKFGRITGIDRPAIALPLPNMNGDTLLLDAGANVDVGPHCLVQYAVMGSIYSREIQGVENPRVGLVNIGEEECKGNELSREALILLKAAPVNFVGNIEGPDLFNGRVDVVVCDGFTGNVILKVAEGVAEFVMQQIRVEVDGNPLLKIPAALLGPAFRRIRRRTDYGERGGALLLGVNGVCLIGHGRSNAQAVANAVRTTGEAVRHGIIEKIREQVAQ